MLLEMLTGAWGSFHAPPLKSHVRALDNEGRQGPSNGKANRYLPMASSGLPAAGLCRNIMMVVATFKRGLTVCLTLSKALGIDCTI